MRASSNEPEFTDLLIGLLLNMVKIIVFGAIFLDLIID